MKTLYETGLKKKKNKRKKNWYLHFIIMVRPQGFIKNPKDRDYFKHAV